MQHLCRLAADVADASDPVLGAPYVLAPDQVHKNDDLGSWILLRCDGAGFALCFRVTRDGTFVVERAESCQERREPVLDGPEVTWTSMGFVSLSTTGTQQGPMVTLIAQDLEPPRTQALEDFIDGQIDQRKNGEVAALDALFPVVGLIGH